MSFSSITFIFYFLPISILFIIISYRISKIIYKTFLLLTSYLFCFWLGKETLLFVILVSLFLYLLQFVKIQKYSFIVIIILFLLFYKYFPIIYKGDNLYLSRIIALRPIAISFVCLSAISFCIDISKLKTCKRISFIDVSLYISYFPKYISGPIVKWSDFSNSLDNVNVSFDNIVDGTIEFIKGLVFKIVIADSILNAIHPIISNYTNFNSVALILCIFTYSFVIYFDFLGYSKMAKGISTMFGIYIPENFNKPYMSKSISEFYRRWHMSLGSFFKEYIYIPLGGNRKNTLFNIFIVMFVSGLWHGEGIAYVIWGIINGIVMIFERKYPFKRNNFFIIINYIIVSILWMPFMLNSFSNVCSYITHIFTNTSITSTYDIGYYFNIRTILLLVISAILSFTDLSSLGKKMISKVPALYYLSFVLLFVISFLFMVNSSYSPFIYFRF